MRSKLIDFKGLGGRVGVLGGTFDPLHLGHVESALACKRDRRLDMLVFLPTPQNPDKAAPQFTTAERVEILCEGLQDYGDLHVSTFEIDYAAERRVPAPETFGTLTAIRKAADPSLDLHFIIGSDCLHALHRWNRPRELLGLASFIVIERALFTRDRVSELEAHGFWSADEIAGFEKSFVNYREQLPFSATRIRESLERGEIPEDELPPGVVRYLRRRAQRTE